VSGGIEGIGDVAAGAAMARVVESAAGEGGRSSNTPACLNCGASLATTYCGACGQKARVHRTLVAFGHDALHSVLHFDGKIWRTLPLLAWRPGHLTRRYVHGERAQFVSPLALFLFCVFFAFAVFGWAAPKMNGLGAPVAAEIERELAESKAEILADIKQLEAESAQAGNKDESIARAIDKERKALERIESEASAQLRQIKAAESTLAAQKARSAQAMAALDARLAQAKKTGAATQVIEEEMAAEKFTQELIERAAESLRAEGLRGQRMKISFGNVSIANTDELNAKAAQAVKNPQLLLYKIQSNAYKFAWALIPLSVPFVWLLFFWKREFKLFDHAVFVTYSLCFMLMLATVLALAMRVPQLEAAGGLAMLFIPPLHMYRQVRHAYGLTHRSAVWRTLLLLTFASTALGLFGALIVALGVTG
jgi:hypothetical protein